MFSSLNHALADTLTPGEMGHQIGCGSMDRDLNRIVAAVADPQAWRPDPEHLAACLASHSEDAWLRRWQVVLVELEDFFSTIDQTELLRSTPLWRLRLRRYRKAVLRVVNRLPGWPALRKP